MMLNLPDISNSFSGATNEQILDSLQKYRKELNFLLMNLDLSNMPAVSEVVDGIHSRLDGADGSFSLIDQQLDSITLAVGNAQGDISSLSLRADGIDLAVSNNAGSISALSLRADGIDLSVSNLDGDLSALQITVGGIQTTVTNQAGDISTLQQTATSIQSTVSGHTTLLGTHTSQITQLDNEISSVVSFTDVTGNEIASKINQTATTISLLASKIDLTGITTIYSPVSDSYTTMYGSGLEITAVSGSSTYEYIIEWDTYIGFELGFGVTTIFPDVVTFEDAVGFNMYVPTFESWDLVTCGGGRSTDGGINISYTSYGITIQRVGTTDSITLPWDPI